MFNDRAEAGILLAKKLDRYRGTNSIVLGIPRGGVVVAKEVAEHLKLPLDVISARKISHPMNTELAVGAITASGEMYLDSGLIYNLAIPQDYLISETQKEQKEALRRDLEFRGGKRELNVKEKNVILVDDGIATGSTILAAIKDLRKRKPKKIIVASPVAPPSVEDDLRLMSDEVMILKIPHHFMSVGNFYVYFPQVLDSEVKHLLNIRNLV